MEKYLVGLINSFDGVACGSVARLHPNGKLDTSFVRVPGIVGAAQCAALQHDGKIVIGGSFASVNGIMQRGIARLLPDGSYDSSFVVGTGANMDVGAIVIQPDGKIVMGGIFTSYNGVQTNRLTRLLNSGSIDTQHLIREVAQTTIRFKHWHFSPMVKFWWWELSFRLMGSKLVEW